jgi:tetratricopeptide (TPR) repeat protein
MGRMLALLFAAGLGVSHFTATGPKACQKRVLEGVLALHSFVYEDAREAFVEAEKAAPCPIAFWGEAMTYDHPIWREQDTAAGRAALAKIPPDAKLSPMERGLVEAARALYESGRGAWMDRLARLHDELPKDDEVALFYALSIYANAGGSVKQEMRAAAIAQGVFERNPDHPGAAHYLIHACDSPDHAILALEAARRYAKIAPAAGHALHMPSHIFVQLGMWPEVLASNLAAVKAGMETVARHDLPISRADWHSYSWLASARLELGKSDEVLPMIARVRELAAREKDPALRSVQAELALKWLSATQEWARTEELLAMAPLAAEDEPGYVDTQLKYEGCHHASYELLARLYAARARLDAAAATGDETKVAALAEQWTALRTRLAAKWGHASSAELGRLVTAARLAQAHSLRDSGSVNDAIEATRALADLEDRTPASGPSISTPAREELGDLLVRSHRFAEAKEAFRAALALRPNRLHALWGLEESARASGDKSTAAEAQSRLAAQVLTE